MEQNIFILIPAYNPDEKLIKLVNELKESGFSHILVIDDGSKTECKPIFKEVENCGCTLVVHEVNKGKDRQLKQEYKACVRWNASTLLYADDEGLHRSNLSEGDAETIYLWKILLKFITRQSNM